MKYTKIHSYNLAGRIIWQIKALRDIPSFNVKQGDIGGWIEKDENLNQDDDSWISENSKVYDDSIIFNNSFNSKSLKSFSIIHFYRW